MIPRERREKFDAVMLVQPAHAIAPTRRGWRCPCGLDFIRLRCALDHAKEML